MCSLEQCPKQQSLSTVPAASLSAAAFYRRKDVSCTLQGNNMPVAQHYSSQPTITYVLVLHCSSQGCVELTWIPDTVKYGISNRTWIGGRPSLSSAMTLGRPKCALMRKSLPPGNDLIVQTTELLSGEYLQLPAVVLNLGESASTGTGTMISTLLAVDRRLNWLFAYDSRVIHVS